MKSGTMVDRRSDESGDYRKDGSAQLGSHLYERASESDNLNGARNSRRAENLSHRASERTYRMVQPQDNSEDSQDPNMYNDCLGGRTFDLDAEIWNRTYSTSSIRDPADTGGTSRFAFNNNLFLPERNIPFGENDQTYYEWPVIKNFDDVDRLFRNSDSTFGQEQAENNTVGVSWVSSPHAVYASTDHLHPALQASCSGYDAFDDFLSYGGAEEDLFSGISASHCHDRLTSDDYQNDFVSLDDYKTKACLNADQVGSKCPARDNALQELPDHEISSTRTLKRMKCTEKLVQRDPWRCAPPSFISSSISPENKHHFPGSRASFISEVGKQMDDEVMADMHLAQHAFPSSLRPLSRKQMEANIIQQHTRINLSTARDLSRMPSISLVKSLEEAGFQQLQNAMDQLDMKTKLCIRDSLYRLARTFKQRQGLSINSNHGEDSEEHCSGSYGADTSNMFEEPTSVETGTNPIDRSIALLLFYSPSEPVPRNMDAVDDLSHSPPLHCSSFCTTGYTI